MDSSHHIEEARPLPRPHARAAARDDSADTHISRRDVPLISPKAADRAPMLDSPGRVRATSGSPTRSSARRRLPATGLCHAVLGRELSLAERARMRSGATVGSVTLQVRRASRIVAAHVSPTAAVTAALGLGAAGAAHPSRAGDIAQQAMKFLPALMPGATLFAGAAMAEHLLPTDALSALERIAHGPHADSLEALVRGLLASRPGDQDAVRTLLLRSLTMLEHLVQASPHPAVRTLLEGVLADALRVADVAASDGFFVNVLPAIGCLVDLGAQAPLWLSLLRNLLGPDAEPIWRDEPDTVGLAAFNALASAHTSGLAKLIDSLCPLGTESGRADDRLLNGLLMIAVGIKGDDALGFVQARLDACSDAPARGALRDQLADAMPALGAMAHSTMGPPVLHAFDRIVGGAADPAAQAGLQLALLRQINPFNALFRQLPGAASAAAAIAFDQRRVPRFGITERDLTITAGAAVQLAASPQLSRLLGLTTKRAAVDFWLKKAADRTIRG